MREIIWVQYHGIAAACFISSSSFHCMRHRTKETLWYIKTSLIRSNWAGEASGLVKQNVARKDRKSCNQMMGKNISDARINCNRMMEGLLFCFFPALGLDDQEFESRYVQECSLLHSVQTGSGAHPASYPMVTVGYFPWSKAVGA
jgi:hypothetical protein